jgi:hypothetical protein
MRLPFLTTTASDERRRLSLILLAATACFAALATPFFLLRVYVADDLGAFHLPVRDFYARQLAAGEPFDWMPSLYGGFYLAGEGQLGGYHPWHWALYRWLPLGAAFDLELLASYPVMFAGAYLWFGRLLRRRDAAAFGALVFTFSGFCLLHFIHPNAIAVVAHLPWLLWAIDVALLTDNRRHRALAELAVGLLTASQLLLGYPQYVWLSLLAEAAFVAWRVFGGAVAPRRLVTLAAAVALGVVAGAIQWLPTWHLLAESSRSRPDAAFANTGALHPLNLIQWLAPYLLKSRVVGQNTHELGLYLGAVPFLLCLWLLAARDRWGRYRPLVRMLLVLAAVSLVLAAGEQGGLYRLQSLVPLANRFRFPCRVIVLVHLAMAALAAVALALLVEHGRSDREPRRVNRVLVLAVLVSIALALAGPLAWPQFVAAPALVWSGPLLVAAGAVVIALVERGTRGAVAALVLLSAADLSVYGLSYSVWNRTADLHTYVASLSRPPEPTQHRVAAATGPDGLRVGDAMLLAGLSRADGYAGLEPAKQLDYRQPAVLELAGVAWRLEPDDPAQPTPTTARRWTPLGSPAARARLITRIVPQLPAAGGGVPPLDAASVEPPVEISPAAPGTATVVSDRPGQIEIDVACPSRQLLATTESFDRGWRVTVDGQPVRVVRVNADFLGCAVERGKHRVRFDFCPRSRLAGGWLSIGGLGLLLSWCGWRARAAGRAKARGRVACRDRH